MILYMSNGIVSNPRSPKKPGMNLFTSLQNLKNKHFMFSKRILLFVTYESSIFFFQHKKNHKVYIMTVEISLEKVVTIQRVVTKFDFFFRNHGFQTISFRHFVKIFYPYWVDLLQDSRLPVEDYESIAGALVRAHDIPQAVKIIEMAFGRELSFNLDTFAERMLKEGNTTSQ